MNKIKIVLVLIIILAYSCKPNAKNEIQYWENHKKETGEAIAKWPNFKTVLVTKQAEAQKIWDEAEKISKEEEKAAKMKEANEFLNDLLNQFSQISSKSDSLGKSIDKLNEKKLGPTEHRIRNEAVADALKSLSEVTNTMSSANPGNEEEAKAITKAQISKLISAQGVIDRAAKSVEPKTTTTTTKKK